MSRAKWVLAGVIASMAGCGSRYEVDETAEGGDQTSEPVGSTTMMYDDPGPDGPCPLEGMFTECETGVAYCDVVDGVLQWGPCFSSTECSLDQPPTGCQTCTLVEGIPTLTGSPTCECEGPAGAPQCEQTECFQRWDYECGRCQSFISGDCFSFDQGCSSPVLGCDSDSPCARVWAQEGAASMLTQLEDEAAAVCVLESLRDGVPGTYEILWGFMDDGGWVVERVHSGGNGTVVVEWEFECPGCTNSGSVGRSGTLSLQPAAWFDDCLLDPTPERLIECTVGLVEYQSGQPPPVGYVPPLVTGDCVSLDAACP